MGGAWAALVDLEVLVAASPLVATVDTVDTADTAGTADTPEVMDTVMATGDILMAMATTDEQATRDYRERYCAILLVEMLKLCFFPLENKL